MRLVTYDAGEGPRAGALDGDVILDVWGELDVPLREADMGLAALLRGGLVGVAEPAEGKGIPLSDARLLPPVRDPTKIVCMGLNYRAHAAEAGIDPPETPTFFAKFQNALAAPGAEVPLPAYSEKVDYEAEVAFVIGSRCRNVAEEKALDHVAGYMLFNDLSARDYQFKTLQWMPGKVFDGSAPCGPALVTPDEAGPHDAIEIELTLNGETMQSSSTADLIHPVPALVAYLSTLMTLEPGDIVATGTPAGIAPVEVGDRIEVEIEGVGVLENHVVRAPS